MKVTKELLQIMCKALNLPTSGNKPILQKRICDGVCGTCDLVILPSDEKVKKTSGKAIEKVEKDMVKLTIFSLIKQKEWKKLETIANDIAEMLDDDSSIISIVKSLSKLHNVKLQKHDVEVFAEIWDAAKKHDWVYIESLVENWGKKEKIGVELAKLWGKNEDELISVLNNL